MNARLISYLRSLGLSRESTDDQAWEFFQGLRGAQRSIAGLLNYVEDDAQARTSCDLGIRSLGYNPENPSELLEVGAALERSTPPAAASAIAPATPDAPVDPEQLRREGREQEQQRRSEIMEYAELSGADDELTRSLIDDAGVTPELARQRLLENHRNRTRGNVAPDVPRVPAQHSRNSQTDYSQESLAAALMLRHSHDPLTRWPEHNPETGRTRLVDRSNDDNIAQAVDRGDQIRGISLLELCVRALACDGIRCEPTITSVENAMRRSASAMSSSVLVGVFTSDINARMTSGYELAPDSTAGWVRETDVNDYKQNDRHRMERNGSLKKRGKGQTAEHRTLSEASENYRVFEYAEQFVIDRQDLINNQINSLENEAPEEMGRAAGELRPDLVYSILLANGNMRDGTPLFHASHGNLLTASPLGVVTLETGRTTMRVQTENGRSLNLMASHVITPAMLQPTSETLVESNLVVTGSDIVRGERNSNSRAGLVPVSDARLDNGVTDPDTGTTYAGNQADWYLSTNQGPGIEVAYISQLGRSPQLRSFVLDRGQFGIGFDISHSIGGKALDWRTLLKAVGA